MGKDAFHYSVCCPCKTKEGCKACAWFSFACWPCGAAHADTRTTTDRWCSSCCVNFCMMILPCGWCLYRGMKRAAVRRQYGVKNQCLCCIACDACGVNQCCDFCYHLLPILSCCAIAQELNEWHYQSSSTSSALSTPPPPAPQPQAAPPSYRDLLDGDEKQPMPSPSSPPQTDHHASQHQVQADHHTSQHQVQADHHTSQHQVQADHYQQRATAQHQAAQYQPHYYQQPPAYYAVPVQGYYAAPAAYGQVYPADGGHAPSDAPPHQHEPTTNAEQAPAAGEPDPALVQHYLQMLQSGQMQ